MAQKLFFSFCVCLLFFTCCRSQHFLTAEHTIARIDKPSFEDYKSLQQLPNNVAERIISGIDWLPDELTLDALLQSNVSSECSSDFALYVDGLSFPGFKKWAIKMADSTGKPESGILDGNYVFEGRFLQCINANEDVEMPPIEPLYCFANWWSIIPSQNPVYVSGLGICIPATCSDDDALILLQTVYNQDISGADTTLHCERGNDLSSDPEAIISIIIMGLFGLLVLVASIYDAYDSYQNKVDDSEIKGTNSPAKVAVKDNTAFSQDEESVKRGNSNNNNDMRGEQSTDIHISVPTSKDAALELDNLSKNSPVETHNNDISIGGKEPGIWEKMLLCFSLYQNVPVIVTAKQPKNTYKCLNGLRVIAMSCVVFGHAYSSGLSMSDNWKVFYEAVQKVGFQKVNTMEVYVDTFFIMSAFLVTIAFLKQLKRCDGKLKPVDMAIHYFNRYWRLTPVYMIMLMIYTNLTHYLISGPYAQDYFADVDSCSTEWWKNMLYINTFFSSETSFCFGVSWYLCVDMQMFIIAPLFIYLLYRCEKVGIAASVAGFCGGIISNIVLWEKYYTQTEDAADPVDAFMDIYIKPWTRCPVYFMGILLGYLFYKTEGKIKMPKVVVLIGWLIALAMFFITAYLPVLDGCYYITEITEGCHWTAAGKVAWCTLYRPMWGIWVCWLITACQAGYGGLINTFLSWNFFVPLGKLTYLCYLIHIMVIIIYWYGTPVQTYFTHLNYTYIFFGILLTTYMCALVMSAGVLAPLTRLAAAFLPSRKNKVVR